MIKGKYSGRKNKILPYFFLKLDLHQIHFVEPELYLNCKEEEEGKQKNQR